MNNGKVGHQWLERPVLLQRRIHEQARSGMGPFCGARIICSGIWASFLQGGDFIRTVL